MHRYTPSSFKWLHGIIPDNSKKMREMQRLYRNFRRREADAKRRMEREKLRRRFFAWLDGKEIEE